VGKAIFNFQLLITNGLPIFNELNELPMDEFPNEKKNEKEKVKIIRKATRICLTQICQPVGLANLGLTKASIRLPARGKTAKGNLRCEKLILKRRQPKKRELLCNLFSLLVGLVLHSLVMLFFTFVFWFWIILCFTLSQNLFAPMAQQL